MPSGVMQILVQALRLMRLENLDHSPQLFVALLERLLQLGLQAQPQDSGRDQPAGRTKLPQITLGQGGWLAVVDKQDAGQIWLQGIWRENLETHGDKGAYTF